MSLPMVELARFEFDPDGICERAVIHECVERSHEWASFEKDKGTHLLREIFSYRAGEHSLLLRNASHRVYQAVLGPWCRITGLDGEVVYPHLRWSDFPSNVVCYRAGLGSPLSTRQFEQHRERLEELWCGPVLIETGAGIGAAPGAVVVRPAPRALQQLTTIPASPRPPLTLPQRIPLQLPRSE
jgi:hypothetical protein